MKSASPASSRRNFLQWAALGIAAGGAAVPAIAASIPDPALVVVSAARKAHAALQEAEDALSAVEQQLAERNELSPYVISVGNPWSGLPPPASTTHGHIDLYTPADMYPERNCEEHEALSAAIARRDARLHPLLAAVSAAEHRQWEALEEVADTLPTTLEGALAMQRVQRDLIGI